MTEGIKVTSTAKFSVLSLSDEKGFVREDAKAKDTVSTTTKTKTAEDIPALLATKSKKEKSKQKKENKDDDSKKPEKAPSKKAASVPQREWTDEMQRDFERIHSVGEECISSEELKVLILAKGRGSNNDVGITLYDGFEPSGRMHIAQGVFKAMNVNKCTYPGTNATFVFWVADWFALMNDKMGGDLEKIKTVGRYLIEVWKAAGMDLSHVVFKWASEEITQQADTYWPTMLDVARRFTISRIKKCCQIMGRLEGSLTSAQILYPLMQCTDIFFLKADICQLGVDQRKVNMLAREYCDAARIKHKPVILSHHMLYGLKAGQEKMSKSDPDSAVFMEDSAEDVERKINNAYCPRSEDETTSALESQKDKPAGESMHLKEDGLKNPCLDYVENIIFSSPGSSFTVGTNSYASYPEVWEAFLSGKMSEGQLKEGLVSELNKLLDPVRDHFSNDENAKNLLESVHRFKKETSSGVKAAPRLDLVALGKVPVDCHMIFAPRPSPDPSLQEAVDLLYQLRLGAGKPCVLFLSDWSARVCSCCDADTKVISAYYALLIASLKAIDPKTMGSVQILYQSASILSDPSNYWLNVINVGRHFMLDKVMGDMKDSENVGNVIDRLMKVADVAGVSPLSLCMPDNQSSVVESGLISEFFHIKLIPHRVPEILFKNAPSIRLQQSKDSLTVKTESEEYYLLDDPKVNVKSKMKKAFCEPSNVDFCPPISLANVFIYTLASDCELTIKRSSENGGDVSYNNINNLLQDFSKGEQVLHPGDLKSSITLVMMDVMAKIADGIKNNSDASSAGKVLKDYKKKISKSKK